MTNQEKPVQVVLKNVRVKWAKLIRPGANYEEGKPDLWSVNMYVTAEDHAKLINSGCTAKTDKDDQIMFVAKRNVVNTKGESVKAPLVVDGRKQPFTEDVGNGSVCNIAVTLFPWERKGGKAGVLLYLNSVQVINHVPMSNGADAFDVIEDAAVAESDKDNDGLPF